MGCLVDSLPTSFEILNDSGSLSRVGQLLRVLIYVAEPLKEGRLVALLEENVQERILSSLSTQLQGAVQKMTAAPREESEREYFNKTLILECRCLQFVLGLHVSWNARTSAVLEHLRDALFSLALVREYLSSRCRYQW